jgi:MSHA biogenesis protein MshJ
MTPKLTSVASRFDALTLRERALIAVSLVAILWVVWDWTLHQVLNRRLAAAHDDVTSLQERVVSEVAVDEQLKRSLADDPNKRLSVERDALKIQIAEVDSRLDSLVGGFVAPSMVPILLEDVVTHHRGVTLQRVANMPVEPVRVKADAEAVPGLYRHVMRVELRGGYFAVRDYLNELEAAPWRFSWRSLNYHVGQFPDGVVVLEVETLSREKTWLGV